MLTQAFHDSCETTYQGLPTPGALEAWEWIQNKLDWTLHRERGIPPAEIRAEFILSYEWCCHYLNLEPARTRQDGPPREAGNVCTGAKFCNVRHVPGLAAITAAWAKAREHYLANQVTIDEKHTALLARRSAAMARNREKFNERQRLKYRARKAEKVGQREQAVIPRALPYERDSWQAYTNFANYLNVVPMVEPEWRYMYG